MNSDASDALTKALQFLGLATLLTIARPWLAWHWLPWIQLAFWAYGLFKLGEALFLWWTERKL